MAYCEIANFDLSVFWLNAKKIWKMHQGVNPIREIKKIIKGALIQYLFNYCFIVILIEIRHLKKFKANLDFLRLTLIYRIDCLMVLKQEI